MKHLKIVCLFCVLLLMGCSQNPKQEPNSSVPTLDELAADWMEVSTLQNFPSLMNFIGGLQSTQNITAFQNLTLPPFSQAGASFGWDESITTGRILEQPRTHWACELLLDGGSVLSTESKWLPYEVQRKATVDEVEMHSFMRMPFEQKGVFLRLVLKNTSSEAKEMTLGMNAYGRVRSYPEESWRLWWTPRPDDDDFIAKADEDGRTIGISDRASSATVAYSFVEQPGIIEILGDKGEARWNLTIEPGKEKVLELVYSLGDSQAAVVADAKRWASDFSAGFDEAKVKWEERWQAAFTPDNTHFSGHYPVLDTDDPKIRRVYYHGALTPMLLCRTGYPLSSRSFVTAGPRWANTLIYFWDLEVWANTMAMLEPAAMKEQIARWFSLDFHNCYAIECFTGKGAGPWYAANDWSIFRSIEAYLEVTGDLDFLKQEIEGKTLLQHLDDIAVFHESRPLTEGSLLTDFGGADNLLECSPSYIQGVPSLNAANVYLLRRAAHYQQLGGNADRAKELNDKAERLLPVILSMYEPGEGVWNAMDAKGNKVPIRHCFDYIVIGQALENDLSEQMKTEMNHFVENELLTRTWMRAMSLKDPAAAQSDRPDHGPMGSYNGWPPMTMDVMCRFGDFSRAMEFLRATEEVTHEGPWAQAHEFLGPDSRGYDPVVRISSRGGQDAVEGCGAAFAETIIRAFFGFRPELSEDKPVLLSPDVPRGFNGQLKHVSCKGKLYTIISDEKGLRFAAE